MGNINIELVAILVFMAVVLWLMVRQQKKTALDHQTNKGTAEQMKEMFTRMEEFKKHQEANTATREKSLGHFTEHISKDINKNITNLTENLHKNMTSLSSHLGQNVSTLSTKVDKQLSEAIEKLGQFKELSKGVDNLSKVLSNVKQKGKFGEYQLESIIEDLVPRAYYHKEYSLAKSETSGSKVDFVIRLPGSEDKITWLPIDSKYPHEPYEKLRTARDLQNKDDEKKAKQELFRFIKEAARSIKNKYIVPPETTDFAILFLPMESIFMECYQDSTFIDEIRREYKVMLTGPNHFYILLHMLQMGYTKMEIEKRSQELWQVLTVFQDGMGGLVDLLRKVETKAGGLHEDIRKVHRKAGRLTQDIKTRALEKPVASEQLTEKTESYDGQSDDDPYHITAEQQPAERSLFPKEAALEQYKKDDELPPY